jgi:hypothetical protein
MAETAHFFRLLPFHVTFDGKFVGEDAWKEKVGHGSHEICSASHN